MRVSARPLAVLGLALVWLPKPLCEQEDDATRAGREPAG
jgi:hypothetical protein